MRRESAQGLEPLGEVVSRDESIEMTAKLVVAKAPRPAVTLTGSWANIDGRLSMVMLVGSGISYVQATGYSPGISVCADILYGSLSDTHRSFKAGDEVAHRIAVFFVEVTPEQTSGLADSCSIETKTDGKTLHFKQPDGEVAQVLLY